MQFFFLLKYKPTCIYMKIKKKNKGGVFNVHFQSKLRILFINSCGNRDKHYVSIGHLMIWYSIQNRSVVCSTQLNDKGVIIQLLLRNICKVYWPLWKLLHSNETICKVIISISLPHEIWYIQFPVCNKTNSTTWTYHMTNMLSTYTFYEVKLQEKHNQLNIE